MLLHTGQVTLAFTLFLFKCTMSMCFFKFPLRPKDLSHLSQAKGFSFRWMLLTWRSKSHLFWKILKHCLHGYVMVLLLRLAIVVDLFLTFLTEETPSSIMPTFSCSTSSSGSRSISLTGLRLILFNRANRFSLLLGWFAEADANLLLDSMKIVSHSSLCPSVSTL